MEERKRSMETMEGSINKDFWKGKRVFLTGHTGFKGSWLAIWLKHLGAQVTGFSLPPAPTPNLFTAADVVSGINSIVGDIRDFSALAKAVKLAQPDIVFHLAAQPLVRASYAKPRETYETNVMGTVNLFEAVRLTSSVKAVVNITTDKCYENNEWVWPYRENDRLGGHDPYANSKACAELVSDAYRRSFFQKQGVALATARAGNVIGGGDWSLDRLIPDIIRAVFEGKPLVLRNPEAVRPWQHVLDVLAGYLLLAQTLSLSGQKYAEGWNFAPSEAPKPVEEIVEMLSDTLDKKIVWKKEKNSQPHEATILQLDASKARKLLHWTPKHSLSQSVALTAAWYKAFYEGKNMKGITLRQIRSHMKGVSHAF